MFVDGFYFDIKPDWETTVRLMSPSAIHSLVEVSEAAVQLRVRVEAREYQDLHCLIFIASSIFHFHFSSHTDDCERTVKYYLCMCLIVVRGHAYPVDQPRVFFMWLKIPSFESD